MNRLILYLTVAAIAVSPGANRAFARGEVALIDLPLQGPLEPAATLLASDLRQAQFDVHWNGETTSAEASRQPQVLVATADAALVASLQATLPLLVNRGAGLVLLVSPSTEGISQARPLLEPFGMAIFGVKHQASAALPGEHPLVAGSGKLACPPLEFGLSGEGLSVLLTQGGVPIAMAGELGRGRLVVLPDRLLHATPAGAINPAVVQLLREATLWAAQPTTVAANPIRRPGFSTPGGGTTTTGGSTSGGNPIRRPGTGGTAGTDAGTLAEGSQQGGGELPPARPPTSRFTEFNARAVIDAGGTEAAWETIRATLLAELKAVNLPSEVLRVSAGRSPNLSRYIETRPGLLVLTPYRSFTEDEVAAVGMYVRSGGTLLALGWAAPATVPQLINLNQLLAEFGLAISYGRPAGPAEIKPHPATANLRTLGPAPAGISCWAFGAAPLATVGGRPVALALTAGDGRVVALDASTLIPPARAATTDDSTAAFRSLLAGALGWLMGQTD